MSLSSHVHLLILTLAVLWSSKIVISEVCRNDFPSDFVFGAGTSAYQVEGAVAEDGRTPSVRDVYTHNGFMADNSNGDIACDGYHRYKEDVKLMSDMGLEAYRFSISWSRLLPKGRGVINTKALYYYNDLIDELVKHGIQPHVTIYQLDLPLILEEEYGGWLSRDIIDDFRAYAHVCFKEFGDRVSHWTTIDEPNALGLMSYYERQYLPQQCSQCRNVNSSVQPYIVMHHLLLAHASAVEIYREMYQAKQKGLIGLDSFSFWFEPSSNSTEDVEATERARDFIDGWVVSPLMFGDYPEVMKKNVGSRLPLFTKRESNLLKGSFDFIGLNHYSTLHIQASTQGVSPYIYLGDYVYDSNSSLSYTSYDPSNIKNLLEYFKDHYGNPAIYIHENGYRTSGNEKLNDTARIKYINGYIESTLDAIRNGSNTRGYFVWSFQDVFEFMGGYQSKYGLVHVDFEDINLKRQPKLSGQWYSEFLKNKTALVKITDEKGISSEAFGL